MLQMALAILPLLAAAPAEEVVEDVENQEVVIYEEEEDPSDVVIYENPSYEDQDCLEDEIVFDNVEAYNDDLASFEED